MRDLRGNRLAMIFQEPMTSLNPSFTVGDQIGEALTRHRGLSARDARAAAIDLLERVRIPPRGIAWTSIRTSSPAACASAS
jgi:peptide/nickel transport system ATP-binding protein